MPTFEQVYNSLIKHGPASVTSARGTQYAVSARELTKGVRTGERAIIASLVNATGQIYIHEDCWLDGLTCQKVRAGGVYRGTYSIIDWYTTHAL